MRSKAGAAGIVIVLAIAFGAARQAHPKDEPYPVFLQPGETFPVCLSGQIVCPARIPICDDSNVAVPVDTPDGLGFHGVSSGTTLCSAASSAGPRRVFRITVY